MARLTSGAHGVCGRLLLGGGGGFGFNATYADKYKHRKAQEERPELEPKSRVQLLLELGSYLLLLAALATLSAVTRGLEGGSPGSPSP